MVHYWNEKSENLVMVNAVFEHRKIFRSNRLDKLRTRVFETIPQIDSSRAKAVTESYKETEGQPISIRRAKALQKTLEKLPIRINEGELIVGEIGPYDRCAQVYPDYGIDWFIEELNGNPFRFENRPGDKFVISEEDERAIREIASYWRGRTHKDHVYSRIPECAWEAFEIGMIDTDYLVICAEGHVIVNLKRILEEGMESFRLRAEKVMERLYHAFVLNNTPIYFMDIPSAEMTKYAANSMLATRISFMNDIANLCEIVGADIEAVKKGIGSDTRIGKKFLNAGCGYGGSCFPKDVKALIRTGDEYGYGMELLKAVERVNERQKTVLFDKIQKHYEGNVKGKHFGLWGLSFKPATDDMREAPSLVLIGQLLEAGATVKAFDPVAMEEAKRRLGDRIGYAANMYDALTDADAMIIVTEWQEFKVPKFTFIEKALKEKVIFDGRNIYNPEQMREFGYTYYGIGKNR